MNIFRLKFLYYHKAKCVQIYFEASKRTYDKNISKTYYDFSRDEYDHLLEIKDLLTELNSGTNILFKLLVDINSTVLARIFSFLGFGVMIRYNIFLEKRSIRILNKLEKNDVLDKIYRDDNFHFNSLKNYFKN